MDDVLLFLAMKYDGDFRKMFHAIQSKESIDEQMLKNIKNKLDINM